jgi:putative colanic acid biosynthesis glycosyltransferase WcaI
MKEKKLRVLIITHIFWPEGADFKNMALAKALVHRGHNVSVLTAFPNYPLGRIYEGYRMTWRKWEFVDGVEILRVPLYPDHSSSGIKRVLNYGTFTILASIVGLLLLKKADVIFVYSPPMTLGLAAWLYKIIYDAPILLDVVDLWPDAIIESDMLKSEFFLKGAEITARTSYKVADKITALTKGFAARIEKQGISDKKIEVMPPWADGNIYIDTSENMEFRNKHNLKNKICIIHAGNIGPFQDIENVMLAAEKLIGIENLRIIFVGGGRDLENMKKLKRQRGLSNVIFAGSYPAKDMPGIFKVSDAMLVSLRKDPYLAINMPSKLQAYMAAGKPIIACAEGETSILVQNTKLGFSCSPGNPDELANTIMKFTAISEEIRRDMGRRSRQVFEQYYSQNVLIERYITILEAMGSNR